MPAAKCFYNTADKEAEVEGREIGTRDFKVERSYTREAIDFTLFYRIHCAG